MYSGSLNAGLLFRMRKFAWMCVVMLAGCSTTHSLMPTPTIYAVEGYPANLVPKPLRNTTVDVLYVTDRARERKKNGKLKYGPQRSPSLAYGEATIEFGHNTSWEKLVEASETEKRNKPLNLKVLRRTELDRFPSTPFPFAVVDGEVVDNVKVTEEYGRVAAGFREQLNRHLRLSDNKQVLIFVHGVNTSFDEAVLTQAELWHILGRKGVPVAYSWPADNGGLFGYFVDRESAEFTIFHFKQFVKMLASFPEVEGINIIAHSRGVAVTTTALRELVIETRAAGKRPRDHLRIDNLVMASADLNFDIVRQRLMAEKFGPAIGQITSYVTRSDKALEFSSIIQAGIRFGLLRDSDLGETDRLIFSEITNVNFIEVLDVNGFIHHNYFRKSPAASSDLILVVARGERPGNTKRPLTNRMVNFWQMPRHYPYDTAKVHEYMDQK